MVEYLRLSLTDKCDLNCFYCKPLDRKCFSPREDVLTFEEVIRLLKLFVKLGIKKIRLTGGEPLLKHDFQTLLKMIHTEIKGLENISLTTNGLYLDRYIDLLKSCGVSNINISLDSLNRKTYQKITKRDVLDKVWENLINVVKDNYFNIKINTVLIKGVNDNEIENFIKLASEYNIIVRFIELYKTSSITDDEFKNMYISTDNIKSKVQHLLTKTTGNKNKIEGPADYYNIKDGEGLVGFIAGVSHDFCGRCNRLRLNILGQVRPCLFSDKIYNLKSEIQSGKSDGEILEFLKNIIKDKPKFNMENSNSDDINMFKIGG